VFGALDGRQLRVASFYEQDRLVGLAPLLRRRFWYRPGIPFRRLELLGTGEKPADAIHPEYLGVLAECGREQQVANALADAITAGALGAWDELVLPMLDANNPLLPHLSAALSDVGLSCQCAVTGSASYIPLPANWEEYLAALSSSHRAYIRQSLRRFEQCASGTAVFHAVTDPTNLGEGRRILADLHRQRWGKEGKPVASRFWEFHDAILPELLDAGALELLWVSVRGEPIAAVYNIVWNGKVYFYQSGRKMDVPAGIRPGIVLHAHAIRRAIEAGRREYDFLGGNEHYKSQLGLATRSLVQLRVTRRCLVEQARALVERGIGWARTVRNTARAVARSLFRQSASW
jgi:hypothetical protein